MAEFFIRHWGEQVLFDCRDYAVTAESEDEAVELLEELLERSEKEGPVEDDRVTALPGSHQSDDVRDVDPEEIVDGSTGFTLIDAKGKRVRDLVSVPTNCAPLPQNWTVVLTVPEGLRSDPYPFVVHVYGDDTKDAVAAAIQTAEREFFIGECEAAELKPEDWRIILVCRGTITNELESVGQA